MQGVAEQRHRTRPHHHDGLSERRHTEDTQRDPQGSHPLPGRLHGGIDRVRRLVGMRLDHVLDAVTETAQSTRPATLPLVTEPPVTAPLTTVPVVMGTGLLRLAWHTFMLPAYA